MGWLQRLGIPAVLATLLVLPLALVSPDLVDPFRDLQEASILGLAWLLVLLVGVARAFEGKVPLGGASWSWCRRLLIAFAGWVLLRNAFAPETVGSWAYAQTVVAFLLVGQAVTDWLEDGPTYARNVIVSALAVGLTFELAVFTLELVQANFSGIAGKPPGTGWFGGVLHALSLGGVGTPLAFGTLGNENFLGEWLAVVLPVIGAWALGSQGRFKVPGLVLVALGFFALIHTGCRAAVLGLAVGAPLAAFLAFGRSFWQPVAWWTDPKTRKAFVGASLFVLLCVGVGGEALLAKLTDVKLSNGVQVNDLAPRLVAYRVARDMWYHHPIEGNGLGAYGTNYVAQFLESYPEKAPTIIVQKRFNQAHNEPLQGLAELGLVGTLLALAAAAFWLIETSANQTLSPVQRMGILWSGAALGVAAFLGFPLHIPATAAAFMAIAAIGLARPVEDPVQARNVPYAALVALAFGAVGILVVLRVAAPIVTASYNQRLAASAIAAGDPSTAADLCALAYRYQRFKPDLLYGWMTAIQKSGHDADAIAFYDAHAKEGMGQAAVVLRAISLEHVGRKDEAIADYKRVMAYYQPDHANYRVAEQALARLQGGP